MGFLGAVLHFKEALYYANPILTPACQLAQQKLEMVLLLMQEARAERHISRNLSGHL